MNFTYIQQLIEFYLVVKEKETKNIRRKNKLNLLSITIRKKEIHIFILYSLEKNDKRPLKYVYCFNKKRTGREKSSQKEKLLKHEFPSTKNSF